MEKQTKVTGVILAGGQAKRMHHQDKGLLVYQGQALISYAIAALTPIVDELIINANRNQERYRQFGYPVIADQSPDFAGPLAGLLSAMSHTDADIIITVPCDSPEFTAAHGQLLLTTLSQTTADVAIAYDGERLQPVFLAIKSRLQPSLQHYLGSGQRKMATWLEQQQRVTVDFSAEKHIFNNINTPEQLR